MFGKRGCHFGRPSSSNRPSIISPTWINKYKNLIWSAVFLGNFFLLVGTSHMRVGVERRSLIARRPVPLTPGSGRHRRRRREHASSHTIHYSTFFTNFIKFSHVANNKTGPWNNTIYLRVLIFLLRNALPFDPMKFSSIKYLSCVRGKFLVEAKIQDIYLKKS